MQKYFYNSRQSAFVATQIYLIGKWSTHKYYTFVDFFMDLPLLAIENSLCLFLLCLQFKQFFIISNFSISKTQSTMAGAELVERSNLSAALRSLLISNCAELNLLFVFFNAVRLSQ